MNLFGRFGKQKEEAAASSGWDDEPVAAPARTEAPPPPVARAAAPAPAVEELTAPVESEPQILEVNLDPQYTLDQLLRTLLEVKGSDLHLESGSPPVFRIRGEMYFANLPPMSNDFVCDLLAPLPLSDAQHDRFETVGNLDLAYEVPGVARFRVNLLRQYRGVGCVIRLIPSVVPSLEQMGLPAVLSKLAVSPRGIVLVTGPTGSGKSTTLAAMIDHVNRTRKAHIITIEDPIEFTHRSASCLIDHREVGAHTKSFASALKACLREDPDIVLVGEMRDLETISLALTAAEMGVLVFGTLHTNSAPKTIDRIIDVFPAEQQEQVRMQLSQSLRAVVAQQLLKKADGSGRIAALEIMICNEGLRSLIREGKTSQLVSAIVTGRDEGMQTMDACLIELVTSGQIALQDALTRVSDITTFRRAGLVS